MSLQKIINWFANNNANTSLATTDSEGKSDVGSSQCRDGAAGYQYQRLDPRKNEIRLLKILPVREVAGQDVGVECSLFVTSLDNTLAYQALSYTWGDQSKLKQIFLDGHLIGVSSNLYSAIWLLRSHSSMKAFWIDALCINQNDSVERSEQVSKMRKIYERAENVVVWLGPGSGSSSLAFSLFEDLYQYRLNKKHIASILRDSQKVKSLEAIIKLFRRDYWSRIWVIQEVNSAKEITITCGRCKIEWSKVKAVQEMLWSDHDHYILKQSYVEPRLFGLGFYIQHRGVKALQIPRDNSLSNLPSLYDMLSVFWHKDTTDPRDKVYALSGLTTARDDPLFVIDYSASVRRVYIDVAKYVLASSHKLDIICMMPRGTNSFDLPSWVPDWTISDTEAGSPLTAISQVGGLPYVAAGSSIAEAKLKPSDDVLIAKGIMLSSIQVVGQKANLESEYHLCAGIPVLLSWYRLWKATRATHLVQVDSFCRTIFYNRFSSRHFRKESRPELMESILGAIAMLAEEICPEEILDSQLFALKERFPHREGWAKSWVSSACDIVRRRRFFITNSNLIGICPSSTESGDIICILLGCLTPVVLHPQDGHYIFLGEAYVDEYMYGKGMEELAEGKFQLELFEIH